MALKPLAEPTTRVQGPGDTGVAVDAFARLEGTPVPEPSVLRIFAAAAGLGRKRLGPREARRS